MSLADNLYEYMKATNKTVYSTKELREVASDVSVHTFYQHLQYLILQSKVLVIRNGVYAVV